MSVDKILKVSKMPTAVQEACRERGFSADSELTIRDAMAEWSAWEIGAGSWGSDAAEYVSQMILGH
jgi:hypothetical protein